HRTEVVGADRLLDPLRRRSQEASAARHPRVAHEEVDRRMPLQYARGGRLDGHAVGYVAVLVLVGVGCAPRQPDRAIPARSQLTDELGADPGRSARDDCYPQIRSVRAALAVRPDRSTTVTVR